VTDPQLAALQAEPSAADFTPAEQAAIAYAEEMTREPRGVSEAAWEALRRHWNDRQIVEITAVAALFNSFNRFNNALDIEPTTYPKPLG